VGVKAATGRRPVGRSMALPVLMLCVFCAASLRSRLAFLSGNLQASQANGLYHMSKAGDMPQTPAMLRGASQWRMQKDRPGLFEWIGTVALGATLLASASQLRLASGVLRGRTARPSRGFRDLVACRAEEGGGSILDGLSMGEEEAGNYTMEGEEFDDELNLTDDDMDGADAVEEEDDKYGSKNRQEKFTLGPSRAYVLYIAKKNAIKTWTKDGRNGPGTNWGCYEVQIAVATEKIRTMILHLREYPHDLRCKYRLISLVARRRWLLDKLSWTDVDAYMNVRDSLKIRHVYRMESLIGRFAPYKYGQENRKRAPGRKVAMRLKKSQRLLNRRLANQLRQGKPKDIIMKTKRKINSRRWTSRAYDEAEGLINDKPVAHKLDPLDLP